MASQDELKAQLKELMAIPENMLCLDCGDKRPMWASIIVPPPDAPFKDPVGCFCCYQCSGAHRRMGVHICFVRSTNLDEWKEKEIIAMREGGNKLLNSLFEAKLTEEEKSSVKPTYQTELDPRSHFIYDKYQHRKWYSAGKPKRKSTFVPPAPIGVDPVPANAGASLEGFDDFFASRSAFHTQGDNWLGKPSGGGGGGIEIHYDPNVPLVAPPAPPPQKISGAVSSFGNESKRNMLEPVLELDIDANNQNPSTKKVLEGKRITNNQKNNTNLFDEYFEPLKSMDGVDSEHFKTKSPSSAQKSPSIERGSRRNLNLQSTLERKESKRLVLDEIRHLSVEVDNAVASPKSVQSASRRKRPDSRRIVTKPLRLDQSSENDARGGRTRRSGSRESDDTSTKRSSSREQDEASPGRLSRRKAPPGRCKSMGAGGPDDLAEKPKRRTVKRTTSDEGGAMIPISEHTTESGSGSGSSRPRREPTRGVGRTRSMDVDSTHGKAKVRSRSRSVKRTVRRTTSSEVSTHSSNESIVSSKSRDDAPPRRPPRLPRNAQSPVREDESQVSRRRDDESRASRRRDEESQTSRIRDESGRNHRRLSKTGERTPSPSKDEDEVSKASSRRRDRRSPATENVPRKNHGNPISIQRVTTARERTRPRSPKITSGGERKLSPPVQEDFGEIFAATSLD